MTTVRRRLLLISYHFLPSSEVAGKPTARLVRHLPKFGWEPVVLTIPADYSYAPLDSVGYSDVLATTRIERVAPGPHLIDGAIAARRLFGQLARLGRNGRRHTSAIVPPTPNPATAAPRTSLLSRLTKFLTNYCTYPDRQAGWVFPALQRARSLLTAESFDAVMTVAPPHSAALIGLQLRRRCPRLPWVAQFHDPLVGNPFISSDRLRRRVNAYLEQAVVRSADAVLLATDQAADTYTQRYLTLPAGRFGVLYNGYDPLDFPSASLTHRTSRRPLTFVYTGALYGARDPFPFLKGVAALLARKAIRTDEIRIEFVGDCEFAGGRNLREAVREMGLDQVVTLAPPVSYPEALERLQGADVLLLFAQGQSEQIPAKLYEYLHIGRFILAFTDGSSAGVIRDTGTGRVVGPEDQPDEAIEAVVRAHRNGELVRTNRDPDRLAKYRAEPLAAQLADHLTRLTSARKWVQ